MEGVTVKRKAEKRCAGGRAVYGYTVETPVFEKYPSLSDFYGTVCGAALAYAAEQAETAVRAYEQTPREKRGSFEPGGYSLRCEIEEAERVFSVMLLITDCKGKNRKESRFSALWARKDGRLIPAEMIPSKVKNAEGFFLRGGALYAFRARSSEADGRARHETDFGRQRGSDGYKEEKIENGLLQLYDKYDMLLT